MQAKATKNNWGPKFELNLPKSSLKLGFLSFFQVWFISFPENCIAWKLGRLLSIIKSKIYEKKIQGPKLYPNSGVLLPFSQGCIISFPWSCTRLQLGEFLTSSRAETSNKKTKKKTKKNGGPNCGQKDLFYSTVIEGPLKLVCFCFYLLHFSFIWFTLILVRNSSINSLVQSN